MTEQQLLDAVIELAGWYGYLIHHDRPARTTTSWTTPIQGHRGFPDLLLTHPKTGHIIAAELKSAKGKLSPDQQAWLNALDTEIYTTIWRPEHWHNGSIERTLATGAGQKPWNRTE